MQKQHCLQTLETHTRINIRTHDDLTTPPDSGWYTRTNILIHNNTSKRTTTLRLIVQMECHTYVRIYHFFSQETAIPALIFMTSMHAVSTSRDNTAVPLQFKYQVPGTYSTSILVLPTTHRARPNNHNTHCAPSQTKGDKRGWCGCCCTIEPCAV